MAVSTWPTIIVFRSPQDESIAAGVVFDQRAKHIASVIVGGFGVGLFGGGICVLPGLSALFDSGQTPAGTVDGTTDWLAINQVMIQGFETIEFFQPGKGRVKKQHSWSSRRLRKFCSCSTRAR